jgi:hypothetical protein
VFAGHDDVEWMLAAKRLDAGFDPTEALPGFDFGRGECVTPIFAKVLERGGVSDDVNLE